MTMRSARGRGYRLFRRGLNRFEVLAGGGHFVADQIPAVSRLMLEHIAAHPA